MNLGRCIHLIENQSRFVRVGQDEYESGFWDVADTTAIKLVGDSIFFHSRQGDPFFYGGNILGFRVATSNDSAQYAGRIIFIFRFSPDHRDILTNRKGWGNEKKIVIEE